MLHQWINVIRKRSKLVIILDKCLAIKPILVKFAAETLNEKVSTMELVSINKERIKYLLSLYKMTVDEFMCVATKDLK